MPNGKQFIVKLPAANSFPPPVSAEIQIVLN
jgi:hypothetical protein